MLFKRENLKSYRKIKDEEKWKDIPYRHQKRLSLVILIRKIIILGKHQ